SIFDETYDLITATEVFEHLNTPLKTLSHISALLEKGGILAIMTSLRPSSDEAFLKWWYRRDFTHVSFFTLDAIKALIKPFPLRLIHTNETNYFVFRKEWP
ncbi:class I SAM-dependent methyltransferase, partial [Methanocalculus natronophilus]|uniref:class I SAM-dependent methyltransferase n=1 Tax=Methanocalculus natronophilus TaxID=1262400 RepID=UPI0031B59EAE